MRGEGSRHGNVKRGGMGLQSRVRRGQRRQAGAHLRFQSQGMGGGGGGGGPHVAAGPAPPNPPCRSLCHAVAADTLRLLLVLGSRVNLPDKEGCTPLHWAAIRGHTEACTVLLQVGPGAVLGHALARLRHTAWRLHRALLLVLLEPTHALCGICSTCLWLARYAHPRPSCRAAPRRR